MSRYTGIPSILPRYVGEANMDLFLSQQNLVLVKDLKSAALGGANLNSATTTVALKTLAGATLSAATLSYVSGSAGRYEGTLPVVSSLVEGTEYLAQITVTSVATTVAYWNLRTVAVNRRD